MPLPVWLSLAFLLIVLTLCGAFLFRTVRTFWREVKSLTPEVDGAVAALTLALERLADRSASFGVHLPRLDAAVARLQASLRRFAVLRAALQDVVDSVGRVAAVYPRK